MYFQSFYYVAKQELCGKEFVYKYFQSLVLYNNSLGNSNNKVNELYSPFLKFSALGLLQDIRNINGK